MKIRVTITVDVNPEAWSLNYGTSAKPAEVRQDVQAHVASMVQEQLREVGVL